jgi:transglutaminase-like putative cysteine protease
VPVAKLPIDVLQYLYPSRYCPFGSFHQIALQEFGGIAPELWPRAGYSRLGYNRTASSLEPRIRSTARWTPYNDKIGVCRDFAHLMISLCRALNIPARFVTSIDYGADPAGSLISTPMLKFICRAAGIFLDPYQHLCDDRPRPHSDGIRCKRRRVRDDFRKRDVDGA